MPALVLHLAYIGPLLVGRCKERKKHTLASLPAFAVAGILVNARKVASHAEQARKQINEPLERKRMQVVIHFLGVTHTKNGIKEAQTP